MSFWNTLKSHAKAQFLDVIQWMEDDRKTVVWRFPVFNQAIQDGGKLVVREGQAAVFVNEGQLSEVFGPGTYELSTRTKAIASFFESIKYALNYPYKGDIFFVSTRQFTDHKWGTPNPIMMNDAQLGPVRIRAFGSYAFRIADPATFLREMVGNQGLLSTEEVQNHVKRKVVSAFADVVGESKIPVLDLAAKYMDLGDALREKLTAWFQKNVGVAITDFAVENISLPPEVEKMLDKRTSMGLVGDMGAYTQFQAANAIETAASRPGAANPMMDAGMGLAMGGMMGQQMMAAQARPAHFNPTQGMPGMAPPPPPPPPAAAVFHYNGVFGQGQFPAAELAQRIGTNRQGPHHVWMPGWAGWKPWSEVPELVALVPPAPPPPPPAPAAEIYHYAGPDGQAQLPGPAVAQKVMASPGGQHLVWKAGWDGWKDARSLPEIMNAGGPPPPPPMPSGPPPFPG